MEIVKSDGKVVEIDCEHFADEEVGTDFQWGHCFDPVTKTPCCLVFYECSRVYSRRGE